MIFAANVFEATYMCAKRVVKLDGMQGLSALPTQEKKILQLKGSHSRNNSQQNKGAEGAADGMQPIGMQIMQPPKQKKKKAVSANQMDKQRLKINLLGTMFQQKKQAEELANGMDCRNATLEQFCYKVKGEEISTPSAKAAGHKAASWAAKCAEQKPKFPSRILCYSVSVALQALLLCLLSKCNSKKISNLNLKSESVLQGRARSAKAILAKAMQKLDLSP